MSITLNNFCKQFANQSKEAQDFLENTAPRLAGAIAIKHAEENFQREGLGGRRWKEVQRRKPGTAAYRSNKEHHPARLTRKILTGDTHYQVYNYYNPVVICSKIRNFAFAKTTFQRKYYYTILL